MAPSLPIHGVALLDLQQQGHPKAQQSVFQHKQPHRIPIWQMLLGKLQVPDRGIKQHPTLRHSDTQGKCSHYVATACYLEARYDACDSKLKHLLSDMDLDACDQMDCLPYEAM